MKNKWKAIATATTAGVITIILFFAAMFWHKNRESYWKWAIEYNISTITVTIFTTIIVVLILREIRNK